MKRIVVVGSSNMDLVVRLERAPLPGETVIGGAFRTALGGKGANQAVAAARAGGGVTFVARVGTDAFGDALICGLRRDRIDVSFVGRDRTAPSGVALIFVGANAENSIAVASGANERLSPAHVRRAGAAIARADVVLTQLESPLNAVEFAITAAGKAGAVLILNPAPARPLPDALLAGVSLLTPNEHEAALLTGIPIADTSSARRASRNLLQRGAGAVIITLGRRGAYVADGRISQLLPGFKVQAVDTTAAGDVFSGALAVAFAERRGLVDAVRFAQAAAAISVTRPGAQGSMPVRAEIERFLFRS